MMSRSCMVSKTQSTNKSEREAFKAEFSAKRASIHAAKVALEAKPKGTGKGKGTGKADHAPAVPAMPSTISQAAAKLFLPPEGTSIWRGVARCEWCAHVPPSPRVCAKWADYGEHGALIHILILVWKEWAFLNGVTYPACCPHADLFSKESAADYSGSVS